VRHGRAQSKGRARATLDAYLANADFDVFAMDLTGNGPSARPFVMNDPCNLSRAQQALFVPSLIAALWLVLTAR
jgi:hypothetical protein